MNFKMRTIGVTDEHEIMRQQRKWLGLLRIRNDAPRLNYYGENLQELGWNPFRLTLERIETTREGKKFARPGTFMPFDHFYGYVEYHRIPPLAYYRNVMHREVVIDPDLPTWDDIWFQSSRILDFIIQDRIPHFIMPTGGKGIHISIYFDYCGDVEGELLQHYQMRYDTLLEEKVPIHDTFMRQALFWYIMKEAKIEREKIGGKGKIDLHPIVWNDLTMGRVVRALGAPKYKGFKKTVIRPGLIALPRKREDMYEFRNDRQVVYFPSVFMADHVLHIKQFMRERGIDIYKYLPKDIRERDTKLVPGWVKKDEPGWYYEEPCAKWKG